MWAEMRMPARVPPPVLAQGSIRAHAAASPPLWRAHPEALGNSWPRSTLAALRDIEQALPVLPSGQFVPVGLALSGEYNEG